MKLEAPKTIFTKALKSRKLKFEDVETKLKSAVLESLVTMAQQARNDEDRALFFSNWYLIPELWVSNFVGKLNNYVRSLYCKKAQQRANNENYKMYVMNGKPFHYIIFSTRQYKYNKKVKVLEKWLTAKDMEEQSCFWCSPKK